MQRLAALARAGVPPGRAGFRIAEQPDDLRGDVLHLEGARLKRRLAEQIAFPVIFQRVGQRPFAVRAVADFAHDVALLAAFRAQPEHRRRLQRDQPFARHFEFARDPFRHGFAQFVRGKCFRLGGETSGERTSLAQLLVQAGFRIDKRAPAEPGENQFRYGAALRARQPGGLEFLAQQPVRRALAARAADDL